MKLGIVLYTSDPETAWNAFRLGRLALDRQDSVKVFLLAAGVECESFDTERFKVKETMEAFVAKGGQILACGTCLKTRQSGGAQLCPVSTLQDLYDLVAESDKVLAL